MLSAHATKSLLGAYIDHSSLKTAVPHANRLPPRAGGFPKGLHLSLITSHLSYHYHLSQYDNVVGIVFFCFSTKPNERQWPASYTDGGVALRMLSAHTKKSSWCYRDLSMLCSNVQSCPTECLALTPSVSVQKTAERYLTKTSHRAHAL